MTAKRFMEILKEYDFPVEMIGRLWETRSLAEWPINEEEVRENILHTLKTVGMDGKWGQFSRAPVVHLTLEVDVPLDQLESVMTAVYGFSERDGVQSEIFVIRNGVSEEEIHSIFSRAAGSEQRIVLLRTAEEVNALKNAARGNLESHGDA